MVAKDRAVPGNAERFRRPRFDRRVLLVVCLFPLALDVKKFADEGDGTLQAFLVGVSVVGAALYFVLERLSPDCRAFPTKAATAAGIWWVYIALSPLPVIAWGVDVVHYLKVLLPYVLFGVGLTVMVGVARRRVDPAVVIDLLLWAALLSTVWRAVYAASIVGVPLDEMRWQILGPAVPFLLGYGAAGMYLRRRRVVSIGVLVLALACIGLSVTRSYVISILLVMGALIVVDIRRRPSRWAGRFLVRFVPMFIFAGVVGTMIVTFFRPDIGEVWNSRLFGHTTYFGLDITFVIRLAEYLGQIDALRHSLGTLLLGNGVGADYYLDTATLKSLPFGVDTSARWFAGHSTWIYPFFASGLAIGAIVPVVIFSGLISGLSSTLRRGAEHDSGDAVVALAIYLSYVGQSITANVFSERFAGLILGIVVGAIFIYGGSVRMRNRHADAALKPRQKAFAPRWTAE